MRRLGIFILFTLAFNQTRNSHACSSHLHDDEKKWREVVELLQLSYGKISRAPKVSEKLAPGSLVEFQRESFATDALLSRVLADLGAEGIRIRPVNSPSPEILANRSELRLSGSVELRERSALRKAIENLSLDLKVGDRVRYRDSSGKMKVGVVFQLSPRNNQLHALIQPSANDPNKANIVLPASELFQIGKSLDHTQISTPDYSAISGLNLRATDSMPRLQELLNLAARLSSQAQFDSLSLFQKSQILSQLLLSFIPPRLCALDESRIAAKTIEDFLRLGVGVCKQLAPLLAVILRESGIPAELYSALDFERPLANGNSYRGHLWIEIPSTAGRSEKLFVDPTMDLLATESEIRSLSVEIPTLLTFHLNASRELVPHSP